MSGSKEQRGRALTGEQESSILVAVVGLLLGAVLLVGGWFVARPVWNSPSWPQVQGEVIRFEVGLGSSNNRFDRELHHIPEISYLYEIDGRTFTGNRITPAGSGPVEESELRDLQRRFPVGGRVPVHYDPSHPSSSTLVPGGDLPGMARGLFLSGGILLLMGLLSIRGIYRRV